MAHSNGQIRLLGSDGWGGDIISEVQIVRGSGDLSYVATVDTTEAPVQLRNVKLINTLTGETAFEMPVDQGLEPHLYHKLRGTFKLPQLDEGTYELPFSTKPFVGE